MNENYDNKEKAKAWQKKWGLTTYYMNTHVQTCGPHGMCIRCHASRQATSSAMSVHSKNQLRFEIKINLEKFRKNKKNSIKIPIN